MSGPPIAVVQRFRRGCSLACRRTRPQLSRLGLHGVASKRRATFRCGSSDTRASPTKSDVAVLSSPCSGLARCGSGYRAAMDFFPVTAEDPHVRMAAPGLNHDLWVFADRDVDY